MRWVMHVDMDAFFASVEQLDNPELCGKPLIVGGLSDRGVVSTCSYEARKFGVHSAMAMVKARQLCPQGIFMQGHYARYEEESAKIMAIFQEFSPCVEALSIDEAFLDLSGMEHLVGNIEAVPAQVKARIKAGTGLTASVGLAPNKFLAKLASDLQKPDGLVIIRPAEAANFIAPLPVSKIFGVGRQTGEALARLGIHTIGQLAACPFSTLTRLLGNQAEEIQGYARGLDERPVISDSERKSLGKETTFAQDLYAQDQRHQALWSLSQQVGWRLRNCGKAGHTVTLKVKYNSFKTITRSLTTEIPVSLDEDIFALIKRAAGQAGWAEPVRLLGVTVGKLVPAGEVGLSFAEEDKKQKRSAALDALKNKFGEDIIHKGK